MQLADLRNVLLTDASTPIAQQASRLQLLIRNTGRRPAIWTLPGRGSSASVSSVLRICRGAIAEHPVFARPGFFSAAYHVLVDLTQSAASTAAQVIPVLGFAVSAAFAWAFRIPKSFRRRPSESSGLTQDQFLDLAAWIVGVLIYISYAVAVVDATLVCFDVVQGRSVAANSAEYVRNVIQAGLLLLFVLPAWAVILRPVSLLVRTVARSRQRRKA